MSGTTRFWRFHARFSRLRKRTVLLVAVGTCVWGTESVHAQGWGEGRAVIERPYRPFEGRVAAATGGGAVLYCHDNGGRLFTIGVATGAVTIIGAMGVVMWDIAFDGEGNLYGVSERDGGFFFLGSSHLYRINPRTAAVTYIGRLGAPANSLAFARDGRLFAAFERLYVVNPSTGRASVVGDLSGHGLAGDLAFVSDGTLYMTTLENEFGRVDVATGEATVIGPLGFDEVWGMDVGPDGVVYGVSNATEEVFSVDLVTGRGTRIASFGGQGTSGANGASAHRSDGLSGGEGSPGMRIDLTDGIWDMFDSVDERGGVWDDGILVFTHQELRGEFFYVEGYFNQRNRAGTAFGTVHFVGSFDPLLLRLHLEGQRVENAQRIAPGAYDARVAAGGNLIYDGVWYENRVPVIPGVWSARRLARQDFDRDGDVDLTDSKEFRRCFSGADQPYRAGCEWSDFDGDGDVDESDHLALVGAFTGEPSSDCSSMVADGFDYPIVGGAATVSEFPLGPHSDCPAGTMLPERNTLYQAENAPSSSCRAGAQGGGKWVNVSDVGNYDASRGGFHGGEDWNYGLPGDPDEPGMPVYAVAHGQVVRIDPAWRDDPDNPFDDPLRDGYVIILKHALPNRVIYSVYLHVTALSSSDGTIVGNRSDFTIKKEQWVCRGEPIAAIAHLPGRSHLHFGIYDPWEASQHGGGFNLFGIYDHDDDGNRNGYYATFADMRKDGILDPSDFIDRNRPD